MRTIALLAGFLLAFGAAAGDELPAPLTAQAAARFARDHRSEVVAARARAAAADQRPAIVSALEDPVVTSSIDHYPFEMMEEETGGRYDWSISVEQTFPLSRVRDHRRRSAEAEADRLDAESDRAVLDVEWGAINAFYMLREKRAMRPLLDEQTALARQVIETVSARYAAGSGTQADVLRAEVEMARLTAQRLAADAEVRAAEAMLNVSLGREPLTALPDLRAEPRTDAPPSSAQVIQRALDLRPELRSGTAEIERANAELDVMKSMYLPMAMVRTGKASTMAEGPGAMLMIGISVPIWRGRLRAGVSEARAMQEMARADLQAMRRMIEGEAAAAREGVVAAQAERQALQQDVLPRAHSAFSSALASYASGQVSLIGVLETAKALWSVQGEGVMADARLGLAWARLDRMTGGANE